ncbi:hypothetical protein Tco_1315084 [Tanacetum coccineum]
MEDEFYNLAVKGNDLKTYVKRFQEFAVLCPNMVPNTKKLMEVFIGGLPRSIEGNVTASKPQTLEEAITITQRLMDQVTEHLMARSGTDLKMAKLLASAAICQKWGCYRLVSRATVIENKILERIGHMAYRLRLPKELSSVHDTFHVSNLKKCLADANLHVLLDEMKELWTLSL